MNYPCLMLVAGITALSTGTPALAAVTAEEAATLGTTLTPVGAERAGNKEGTIPPWTGGMKAAPSGYKTGDPRPDPFAGDAKRFSITTANLAQHRDKLSAGTVAMFERHPDFRIDVYPTHRTAAAPQWVYDNIARNATRATTKDNGLSVEGAYGGIPFPIPKDGFEIMWNHLLAWKGQAVYTEFRTYVATAASGPIVMAAESVKHEEYPYYYKDGNLEDFNGYYFKTRLTNTAPSYKAGEAFLALDPVDMYGKGRQAWQYLVGQRRVRKAPSIAYDTPDFITSGQSTFDEALVFNGSMDRYTMKLVGKRELYIPYNTMKALTAKPEELLGPSFLNPDLVRWELHRVWVVDAELAPGKRNIIAKRRFYIDEDTWLAVLADEWDAKGQLWKLAYSLPFVVPELPAVVAFPFGQYDLQSGGYVQNQLFNGLTAYKVVDLRSSTFFTPDALAAAGVR